MDGAGVGLAPQLVAQEVLQDGAGVVDGQELRGSDSSALAKRVVKSGGEASWSGVKGLRFGANGILTTPWGGGQWGALRDEPSTLYADFIGQQHVLTAHPEGWPKFNSMRCADFENVTVVFDAK